MKTLSLTVLALATALAIVPAALADSFSFIVAGTGTNNGETASLNLVITGSTIVGGAQNGDIQVTGVSFGSVTFNSPEGTQAITGLATGTLFNGGQLEIPPATSSPSGPGPGTVSSPGDYDDLLIPNGLGGWKLDTNGLALLLANGDDLQVYYAAPFGHPSNLKAVIADTNSDDDTATYSTSPNIIFTPEPSTLLLFGTGLLGMAGLVRRKFMQSR